MKKYKHDSNMSAWDEAATISRASGARTANRPVLLCMGLLAVMMLGGCHHKAQSRRVMTKPLVRDTVVTHSYVGHVRSCRHTEIRAKNRGYLEVVNARAGRLLHEGEEMFKILPYSRSAAMKRAMAGSTSILAPFSGRADHLRLQGGSLVREGDVLTTLSDNSEVWVDFSMPQAHYKEYTATAPREEVKQVRMMLANRRMFDQTGRVDFVKAEVSPKTGSIPFRAVFPNPKDLLRNGETGNIRIENTVKNALLVPQKATFEFLDHHYVFVVGGDHVIHKREIDIVQELEDFFRVAGGVTGDDTIICEGVLQVHDGDKADDFVFEEPARAYEHLRFTAR